MMTKMTSQIAKCVCVWIYFFVFASFVCHIVVFTSATSANIVCCVCNRYCSLRIEFIGLGRGADSLCKSIAISFNEFQKKQAQNLFFDFFFFQLINRDSVDDLPVEYNVPDHSSRTNKRNN